MYVRYYEYVCNGPQVGGDAPGGAGLRSGDAPGGASMGGGEAPVTPQGIVCAGHLGLHICEGEVAYLLE